MDQPRRSVTRIERAVALMARGLAEGQVPSLDELAAAAAMSRYHFHRVYRLVTGETCSQTMARLRLVRGVDAMRAREVSVADAAFLAGYGSGQAFAKALRQHLRQTPSDLRQAPERLARVVQDLGRRDAAHPAGNRLLSVQIASLDPFEVVAVRTAGRYPALAETYTRLFEAIGGVDNLRAIVGVPHGNAEDGLAGDLVFDCGFQVQRLDFPLDAGRFRLPVAGGDYLLARHVGPYAFLPDTLNALYEQVIAADGVDFDDRPCVFHYIDDPEQTDPRDWRTDVYVPIALA